ncbi:MAG: thioester domain-containing protein [Clostridia bacterium]|nr:thioester domain-containing protein [Clostridia bacterium]
MKSNKIKETIGSFKERVKRFVFTEEAIKSMEAEKQLPEAERNQLKKQRKKDLITSTISTVCMLVIVFGISVIVDKYDIKEEQNNNAVQQTVELPEGERGKITTGELNKYMVDKLNGIYVKIAYAEIDGKVAYAVTYNNDNMPEGEVVYTHFLTGHKVTTILLNGYPYVSYEEMGLQNDEEAYMATQLAVYEMISINQIKDISNGTFSLDKIRASEEQYEEMVERVVNKAQELVEYAAENTYENLSYSRFDVDSVEVVDNGNETLIGPFYTHTDPDEYVKMYMGEAYEDITEFKATSFYEESNIYTCDKDGNAISQVATGEPFYVKVIGNEKYFSQLNVSVTTPKLYTRIYAGGKNEKKYAVLANNSLVSKTVTSLSDNVDTRDVKISFVNSEGETIDKLKYKLYDETGKILQDNDGYSGWNEYRLPLGKYYVEIYDVPDEYFLNSNRYEIDLSEEGDMVKIDIEIDSLEDFLIN